ncbi:hypothetical protein RHS04_04758 [Rhizoctonia solani]|uniref:Uncharacterized protein n=1 Tax=Rhizoctonia solani TaxID=456999 RepID=A0A8H7HBG0_9AGAM|nr:hypothetical protein RHS04_04758 [Rhizoctonia solani]
MSLARYNLRFLGTSDSEDTRGIYATSDGIGNQIKLQPLAPDLQEQQTVHSLWNFLPGNIAEDKYRVVLDSDERKELSWGYGEFQGNGPILLSGSDESTGIFFLRKSEHQEQNVYTLTLDVDLVGAAAYAGVKDERLEITMFPITPDICPPLWKLERP